VKGIYCLAVGLLLIKYYCVQLYKISGVGVQCAVFSICWSNMTSALYVPYNTHFILLHVSANHFVIR